MGMGLLCGSVCFISILFGLDRQTELIVCDFVSCGILWFRLYCYYVEVNELFRSRTGLQTIDRYGKLFRGLWGDIQ